MFSQMPGQISPERDNIVSSQLKCELCGVLITELFYSLMSGFYVSELVLVYKGEVLLKMQIRTLLCSTGNLLVVFSKLFLETTEWSMM